MERKTGKTTRAIDAYIQQLFTEGYLTIEGSNRFHEFELVLGRLYNEHSFRVKLEQDYVTINRAKYTIELKNKDKWLGII